MKEKSRIKLSDNISVGTTWIDGRTVFKPEGKWSEFFYGICHFSKLIFAVTPLDYEQATMINTIDVAPNSRVCSRSGSCLCFGCALNRFTRDDFCKEFIDMGAFTLGLPQSVGTEPLWFNDGKLANFWYKFIITNEGGNYKYNEYKQK